MLSLSILPPAFPTGAYPMPEVCRRLTEATGVAHGVDGNLRDYPVFVSVRGGDPKRVESLVAAALGGEWQRDGKTLRLTPIKPKKGAGEAEFERQFRLAAAGRSYLPALPLTDLYAMPPGSQVRFGLPAGGLFRAFNPDFAKKVAATPEGWGRIVVRRDAYGSFTFRESYPDRNSGAFSQGNQLLFAKLPPEVIERLGDDAAKKPLATEDGAALIKAMNDPTKLGIDWHALDRDDPIAHVADLALRKTCASISEDVVVALPDMVLMGIANRADGKGTVAEILGASAEAVEWGVRDGAIVGALPECERLAPAQARRSVLSDFVASAQKGGVPTPDDLAAYLADQRSAASDTWGDVFLLVMAGVVIDDSSIGDHPYNLRLERALSPTDWKLVGSGALFPASSLGLPAREALASLLLDSRDWLDSSKPDPATWVSLSPDRLQIAANLSEEDVLIAYTGFAAEVRRPSEAQAEYTMRKASLGREPLYQPAHRRRLKLTVTPLAGGKPVETGFAQVTPDARFKATPWASLPEAVRKAAGPPIQFPPPPVTTGGGGPPQ